MQWPTLCLCWLLWQISSYAICNQLPIRRYHGNHLTRKEEFETTSLKKVNVGSTKKHNVSPVNVMKRQKVTKNELTGDSSLSDHELSMKPLALKSRRKPRVAHVTKKRKKRRSSKTFCPPGFINRGQECYQFAKTETGKTFPEAVEHCKQSDAFLAEPRTQREVDDIADIIKFGNVSDVFSPILIIVWIGAKYNDDKQAWVWNTTGENISTEAYNDLKLPQNRTEDCVIQYGLNWDDKPCTSPALFFCQTHMKAICPPGFIHRGLECYKAVKSGKSFPEAVANCSQNGTFLAEPKTQREVDDIDDIIKSAIGSNPFIIVWIGATYDDDKQAWVWNRTGENISTDAYNDGHLKLPDSTTGDCMVQLGLNSKWVDTDCTSLALFFCQTPVEEMDISTSTNVPNSTNIPESTSKNNRESTTANQEYTTNKKDDKSDGKPKPDENESPLMDFLNPVIIMGFIEAAAIILCMCKWSRDSPDAEA